jgi:phage-related protein
MDNRYEVRLFEGASDFIVNLPPKLQAKALRAIDLLTKFGHTLSEPHSKFLSGVDGIKELRVKQGSDICRLFYFHFEDKVYVITSGYIKKEQKTKKSEIDKAVKRMKQYVEENKND